MLENHGTAAAEDGPDAAADGPAPSGRPMPRVPSRLRAVAAQAVDVLRLLPIGGPGCCNIAVTNVCNANCDFCGYARDKTLIGDRRWIDTESLLKAFDILHARGVRYVTFTGGEPTLHPDIALFIRTAVAKGMRASMVTNAFTLRPQVIEKLAEAGLRTLYISIDSPHARVHERNRGLKGVWERVRQANGRLRAVGIKTVASVTVSKLLDDFDALVAAVKDLGFDTVTFAYPKRELGSTSLVYSESSSLVDWKPDDLVEALEEIRRIKTGIAVQNPVAGLREMQRFLRGERQAFACVGGYKYFLLDWNLNVFRCDYWSTPIGTIWEFADRPFLRDTCTACMSTCYRDASVYMGLPVAIGDALAALRRGRPDRAVAALARPAARGSIAALLRERGMLRSLARTR